MVTTTRVIEYGTGIVTGPLVQCSASSGGTSISGNGSIFSITIVNISGNSPMWVGGSGSRAPVSGIGIPLYGGAAIDIRVDDTADVYVFAEASGQKIAWLGVLR